MKVSEERGERKRFEGIVIHYIYYIRRCEGICHVSGDGKEIDRDRRRLTTDVPTCDHAESEGRCVADGAAIATFHIHAAGSEGGLKRDIV